MAVVMMMMMMMIVVVVLEVNLVRAVTLGVVEVCLVHQQSSSFLLSEGCCFYSCDQCGVVSSMEEVDKETHLSHETHAISSCPLLDHV
jgi:hypothetical protein